MTWNSGIFNLLETGILLNELEYFGKWPGILEFSFYWNLESCKLTWNSNNLHIYMHIYGPINRVLINLHWENCLVSCCDSLVVLVNIEKMGTISVRTTSISMFSVITIAMGTISVNRPPIQIILTEIVQTEKSPTEIVQTENIPIEIVLMENIPTEIVPTEIILVHFPSLSISTKLIQPILH